jgi:hypothetical protein
LNFDKKGNFHQTLVGGSLTILIWILMLGYFVYGSLKISTHGQDQISSSTSTIELNNLGNNSFFSDGNIM